MSTNNGRRAGDRTALTRTLIAVSFGLGAAELLAPEMVATVAGVSPTPRAMTTIRWLGCREVCHGLAILTAPKLVWTRIAGDVIDVGLLAAAQSQIPTSRRRAVVSGLLLTAVGALDIVAARRHAALP